MSVPRTVQVGPIRYKVNLIKGLTSAEGNEKLLGSTDSIGGVIKLEPDQGPDALADTMLHEILHACWSQSALETDIEEAVIRTLTPALLDTLRRNPTLRTFLFG